MLQANLTDYADYTADSNKLKMVAGGKKEETHSSDASPERIAQLAVELAVKMQDTVDEINHVNSTTRLLAINAKIEAARAGAVGAAFSVVAGEIGALSDRTAQSTKRMALETQSSISELKSISQQLATNVRGTHLSDLALTNIDLIDRNLYERSCDVRWWATDSSAVDALTLKTDAAFKFAGERFGVILSSYTVYYDLVLCDLEGNVVANGRPHLYRSAGMNCSSNDWFKSALATKAGDEFGFESCCESPLVSGQRILTYSCTVRKNGEATGKPIGVLGILFNWDALAQTIVENTPVLPEEKQFTRACIVDADGMVIADTEGHQLRERLNIPGLNELFRLPKGATMTRMNAADYCVGHAFSPGYETYATGWHSVIIQKVR